MQLQWRFLVATQSSSRLNSVQLCWRFPVHFRCIPVHFQILEQFQCNSSAFSNSRAVSVQLLRKLKPRCSSVAISIENLMAVSSAEFRNVFNNTFHFSPIGGFFRVTIQCRVSALRTAPDEISLHRRFEDRQDARTILFDTFEDSLKM